MTGKFQSILLGAMIVGLLATILSLIQFGVQSQILGSVACCLIPTLGAIVATWHFASTNALTIPAGQGAMMGLSVALLGWVISTILSMLVALTGLMPSPFDVDAIVELAKESMVNQGNSQAEIDTAVGFMRQYYLVLVAVTVVVYGLIGAVAGAIGANVFKHGAAAEVAE